MITTSGTACTEYHRFALRDGREDGGRTMRRVRGPATLLMLALGAAMLGAALLVADGFGQIGMYVAGAGLLLCAAWGEAPAPRPEG